MSSSLITAMIPAGKPGTKKVVVVSRDGQRAEAEFGFTYNPIPVIKSITPNYGKSSGGTSVIIKGSGFLQEAKVVFGFISASATVLDDRTIEAITPKGPVGNINVMVINPDTQFIMMSAGFYYIGKLGYNYPNPFHAEEGTTFRFLTNDKIESIEVKIFNTGGIPIDIVRNIGTNEVRWQNSSLYKGIYVYIIEVTLDNGKKENYRGVLEVL